MMALWFIDEIASSGYRVHANVFAHAFEGEGSCLDRLPRTASFVHRRCLHAPIRPYERPQFRNLYWEGNKMKKVISGMCLSTLLFAISGCATIVGSTTQVIPISSTPSHA